MYLHLSTLRYRIIVVIRFTDCSIITLNKASKTMTKILLAEDNDFVRMQINRFLVDDGYEVVEAPDGLTALNLIDESIKLAIVDIRMEPIDGLEFTKSLRAKNNSTPVIFITGDQSPDLLSEASKLGVKATLMKPVEKDRLLKMVARSIPQTI